MATKRRPADRRIQKTQKLLHEALSSLISEKDYDSIVVKEILERANVGRSTFYTHFQDKDALLVSGIHEILGPVRSRGAAPANPRERLIWFSLPIFEHHDQHQHVRESKIGPRGRGILHEHLKEVLAELIAADARKLSAGRGKSKIPPDLLVQYIASTFILVLNWWLDDQKRMKAREADELFRALVMPIFADA